MLDSAEEIAISATVRSWIWVDGTIAKNRKLCLPTHKKDGGNH